jgi:hypothetical protein
MTGSPGPRGVKLNLWGGHLGVRPLGQETHMMVFIHRKWKIMYQYGRSFVPNIYVPMNTFYHSNNNVLSSNIPPFLQGRSVNAVHMGGA